ncbi:MAG TPA: phosphopantetheine-binding protein [Phycisphaerae bacterium]|nr:phosphopantetheine-binding protein [Phycisphaerae bacterium]
MPMTQEEVFNKVREVLTNALAVDSDEVKPEARLNQDLGAESIDYLDIQFQLEKAFNIKISQGELWPESLFSNPEYVSSGKLTPKGLDELRRRMPFADLTEFEKDPDVNKFRDVFTVNTLVNFVLRKINGR